MRIAFDSAVTRAGLVDANIECVVTIIGHDNKNDHRYFAATVGE
ncbi:MAG: hypothetical protein ACHBNF_11925 [Chromatiales bacterium]